MYTAMGSNWTDCPNTTNLKFTIFRSFAKRVLCTLVYTFLLFVDHIIVCHNLSFGFILNSQSKPLWREWKWINEFWISRGGFRISGTEFQPLSEVHQSVTSNFCQWNLDFEFLALYSGFQSQWFRVPLAKFSRIPDFGFMYMGPYQ